MIILLAIILFIIFLIYSIKPKREEYTLEGLNLFWANKGGIEGVVTKWVVTLKDSSGNVIHTYENNEPKNLKDFTDVTMNIINNKEFNKSIIGNNTLELYWNEVKPDNKLYSNPVVFTKEDFGGILDISKLNEIVPNFDCVGKYIKVKKDKNTEGAERFACGPEDDSDRHYCQFWKHKIETEKTGTGKACSRANNHVIKTQWPTETTANKRIGTSFQNDPNPNTNENVLNDPQHYKNIWDKATPLITEIPHQIPSAAPGGWCNHRNSVHQDVPGCGRICSDSNTVGRKDKGTWGSWNAYPGSVNCPAAKLDQVWKKEGNSRKLAFGKYSEVGPPPPPPPQPTASSKGIRYVWFGYEKSGWPERPLNIAEIEVYSGGVNIVKDFGDGKVQSSSIYANWTSPKNLFDGNKSSMAHTNDSGTNYFKIDLGKEYSAVDKVMVHNRDNCCYERWAGSFVKLLDKDGVEIMRSTDTLPIVANKNDSTNITKAKNYKEGGVRVKTFTFDHPARQAVASGFKWEYFGKEEPDGQSYLPLPSSFNNATPTKTGTGVTNFTNKNTATNGYLPTHGLLKNYAVRWTGYFVPKKTGTHKFWTQSDDMSYLYVRGVKVVDNGGLHGYYGNKKSGTIDLQEGEGYKIIIYFGEKGGGDEMTVWFQGPDMNSDTHDFSGYVFTDNPRATTAIAAPANQDCEGSWVNDPTGRSKSYWNNNYKTMKWVETKKKIGNGKDCKWAFTRKNPHKGATDVSRNWAGYIKNSDDKWTSEIVTDGQKGEVFNHQNEYGFQMKNTNTNYLKYCMRHANVPLDQWGRYSKSMYSNNAWLNTGAYGREKVWFTCDDED